ncbi:MAG: Gfo/Idh/MocA family protein, partial [Planctomycetota bacterium]
MSKKIRYAHVGLGGRSRMYLEAIAGEYSEYAEMVGICDSNPGRAEYYNSDLEKAGHSKVPAYSAEQFDQMIAETKPDKVIVTTGPDATHSDYIVRAMELGCDVITEKPMTTDEQRCQKILKTRAATGRDLQVTFNYRYSPHRCVVKELIMDGRIGEVYSVDFTWPLDTDHGADYFRRWHRQRGNSGSLLVHKATHHFDLVNWWIDDVPEEVFAHGSRKFYTPQTADEMGLTNRAERCLNCPEKGTCKFVLDMAASEGLKKLYLDHEHHDGYFRDRCVFSEEIDIWDTMSLSVRYSRGALMNYTLMAYAPWEGYYLSFTGSKGRIEHNSSQFGYVSGRDEEHGKVMDEGTTIILQPHFVGVDEWES